MQLNGLYVESGRYLGHNLTNCPVLLPHSVGLYLASRVAYNISYIQNSSHQKADWRSVFFNTGVVLNWIVFVKACWKINPMSNT
jgi:uncharacterized MAPEG superfamily protein